MPDAEDTQEPGSVDDGDPLPPFSKPPKHIDRRPRGFDWEAIEKIYVESRVTAKELAAILKCDPSAVSAQSLKRDWVAKRRASSVGKVDKALEVVKTAEGKGLVDVLRQASEVQEKLVENAGLVLEGIKADYADWVSRRNTYIDTRKTSLTKGAKDPGPWRERSPFDAQALNALMQALNRIMDWELKRTGQPTSRHQIDVRTIDLTRLIHPEG